MAANARAALDAVPLKNIQAALPVLNVFKNSERKPLTPVEKASVIYDMAVIKTDVTHEWIAAELQRQGFRVSVVLVSHWRNPLRSELPHGGHIAALGADFERTHAKCQSLVNGWGKAALMDVLVSMGELAEAISA